VLRRAAADSERGHSRRRSCRGRADVDRARRAGPPPAEAEGVDTRRRGPAWPVAGSPAASGPPAARDLCGSASKQTCTPQRPRWPDLDRPVAAWADANRAPAGACPGAGAGRSAPAVSQAPPAPAGRPPHAPSRSGSQHKRGSGWLAPAAVAAPRLHTSGRAPSANVVRFGFKVWVVAVEPIDTPVGFEVGLIQKAPDTRTTHCPGAPLRQRGDQVVETPSRGGAVVPGRLTGGHRQHIQPR
jgi:hypothetical protein